MIKRLAGYAAALSLCMSLLFPGGRTYAAEANVKVTLPSFAVTLNGHTVENQYREYPLLVYRGITYFPMTWYDTRMLGLEAIWSQQSGLQINQQNVTASYAPYKSKQRNAVSYTAKVTATAVTVNGKMINNKQESYPLLSFRNVTYFPLTWRFAHDEFGWDYNWSSTGGLRITSHNQQLQTAALPADAGQNDVALYKGYYYFVETTGVINHVYRSSALQPSKKEEIYSYIIETDVGLQKMIQFQIRGNALWFTYHLGGGIMGSDQYVKISEDGKAKLMHSGYLDFRDTPEGTLLIYQGASAFEGSNLRLLSTADDPETGKSIGEAGINYGVHIKYSFGTALTPDPSTTVMGDDLYILASRQENNINQIHKIDLKTNTTEVIIQSAVSSFRIIGNKLYYTQDEDGALYSSALDGTGKTKMTDHAVSWFDNLDGNLYYTTKKGTNEFELYKADPAAQDPLVWPKPFAEVHAVNGILVCRPGDNDGAVLLNASGSLLVNITDPISNILTSDEGVLLQTSRDSSIELMHETGMSGSLTEQ
ncbi:DUF5050 domain-containing protein [Paenibacillus protaetiae]|uniref:DUF5050 domain-containing protein n=1 Tax=Paenibacillus protaetiae TaxID=2509456 RepID=A0A4P6ETY8_9BACL|nr:DUF5050 domain-containing protein [Paenibacillus protaetiae]QAY66402.1 DUF5050 domain-containing protein [Paenibacillus protaetiae]